MKAAGDFGPSSSILAPSSCVLDGTTVTAEGSYTNGGFAPNVYNRYGDVVELYVYGAASADHPIGVQVAKLSAEHTAPIGGYAPWRVWAPLEASLGAPTRCVVVAQPTHAEQLAP